jgi:hypothetical protein
VRARSESGRRVEWVAPLTCPLTALRPRAPVLFLIPCRLPGGEPFSKRPSPREFQSRAACCVRGLFLRAHLPRAHVGRAGRCDLRSDDDQTASPANAVRPEVLFDCIVGVVPRRRSSVRSCGVVEILLSGQIRIREQIEPSGTAGCKMASMHLTGTCGPHRPFFNLRTRRTRQRIVETLRVSVAACTVSMTKPDRRQT